MIKSFRLKGYLILYSLISLTSLLFADAAGILPYSYLQDGTAYFLLGYESGRGWTDFGGKCDTKDRVQNNWMESAKNTAKREFQEETLMLYRSSDLIPLVKNAETKNKFINHTFSNKSKYCMFFVNFENAVSRNGKKGLLEAADFRSELKNLNNTKGSTWLKKHGAEKEDYVRVRAKDFLSVLNDIKSGKIKNCDNVAIAALSKTHKNIILWPTFARMLKANIDTAIQITTDIIKHN